MAREKILILEGDWWGHVADTRATSAIYSSAETLLSVHPKPVRIIQRPLVSTTYLKDIKQFVSLGCNRRGPNVIILSAHGRHTLMRGKKHRRKLSAFDADINISTELRTISRFLRRTIFILDACGVGTKVELFRKAVGALGTIGFSKEEVNWVDSSIFVLALLLHFQERGVLHLKRARANTLRTTPLSKRVVEDMISGPYCTLASSVGVKYSFGT